MYKKNVPGAPLKFGFLLMAFTFIATNAFSQCPNLTLPVAEGFNNTVAPNCWAQQNISGSGTIQFVASSFSPSTTPEEGTDYVWWNSYGYSGGYSARLVSPAITTIGTTSVDVSFYWYNENSFSYNSGNFLLEGVTLQYSFDSITWTNVQFYPRQDASLTAGTGQWNQKLVTLPLAAGNVPNLYIGFKFLSELGDNCSLDNLHIQASPPCPGGPSAINPTSVTPYTATINWAAAPTPPAGYNWRIVPTGDSINSIAVDSGYTLAPIDSALVTGLSPSTTYDIYVQSNCGGVAGVGYWIGPVTFTTPCITITALPWHEGFEGLGTNVGYDLLPPCWAASPTFRWHSADAPLIFPNNINARTGTNYIYDTYNALDTVYTPGFSLTGGTTYEFYYYYQTDGYQGWDSIKTFYGTSQSPSGMTQLLGTPLYSPTNKNYTKWVTQFTPATSGTYYFAVNVNASFFPSAIAFDDFWLTIAPPCPGLVSNEKATNLSPNSATLSWAPAVPSPSGGYNWELVATGDSVNGNILFSGTTAAGVDSAIATGLQPNTTYDLYVQTNCSGIGVGDWTGPLTFTTPCAAITSIPWHESFEGLGSNTGTDLLPPCWLPTPSLRWVTSSTPLTFAGITPRIGSNFLYNYYNADDTVFTPGFALTAGTQYEFYFYYQTDGHTGWDSIYAMYGNFQSQTGMTTRIGSVVTNPVNTSYQKYSAIFTPATTGTYYFGVKLASTFSVNDIGFDDFGLQKVVPCPATPVAGVITGPSSVCPGSIANLVLTGYSPYTQLQWQTSTDSITFYDLVGSTQDYLDATISSTAYFRVKVTCADSSYTSTFAVHLSSSTNCYCSNLGGYCGSYNIDTVSLLATNFYVADPNCHYNVQGAAYTAFPDTGTATTTLQRGGTYTISAFFSDYTIASVWIDYNQNGIYEPSEWTQITTYGINGTAPITIPTNALIGLTGMRVRTNYSFGNNGPGDGCTYFYDGETFDFHITIADTLCSHAPTVLDTITNASCPGRKDGAIAVGISGPLGPYSSLWSTGDTVTFIKNLYAGRYVDTISFNYGCRYLWSTDTVGQQPVIQGVVDSINPVKCFGSTGSIYLTPTGGTPGYNNHWNTGATTTFITGQLAGVYTDTITDIRGCKSIVKDTLPGPISALVVIVDSVHNVSCNGQSNGAIIISHTGGTSPLTYSWSNTSTSANLTGVPKGFYTVNVTDYHGCTATVSDSVREPGVLTIVKDSVHNTQCYNSSDGSIYVTVSGGTYNYTYLWTGGVPTYNLYLVPAGIYTLSVTDANNCTASITDTVTAPAPLSITCTSTAQTYGHNLGTATASASGGLSFRYYWSNGDSTATISGVPAGVYTVTAIDQNGCSITQRDTVALIVTSVNEVNADIKNFNIYPNPSTGQYNVLLDLSHNLPVQIEVFDITGQLLPIAAAPGAQNDIYTLDLTAQPDGIYIIKLTAGDNTLMRRITLVK